MPRTKQPRKRGSSLTSSQEDVLLRLEDIEKQLTILLKEEEDECNMAVNRIISRIDTALGQLPKEIREMTRGELLNAHLFNEDANINSETMSRANENSSPNHLPTRQPKKLKRQTAASTDDGYMTEGTAPASQKKSSKHVSRIDTKDRVSTKKSRRITRMQSASPVLSMVQPKERDRSQSTARKLKNKNVFNTPAPSNSKPSQGVNFVTPKIKPNTPLNFLRHPRTGEVALSMQGSPLFVSAFSTERMANVNVPLNNGNVMALLPKDGLRLSHIPDLDEDTKSQLETLKHHIEQVLSRE
ncbi:borealin [Chelonus insularis]|uniref:borealin n=1 Tax=Chelonus insularis TaxID=460826 RepID=UPI00158D58FA|nr:borealin [Chelonus insularis]